MRVWCQIRTYAGLIALLVAVFVGIGAPAHAGSHLLSEGSPDLQSTVKEAPTAATVHGHSRQLPAIADLRLSDGGESDETTGSPPPLTIESDRARFLPAQHGPPVRTVPPAHRACADLCVFLC